MNDQIPRCPLQARRCGGCTRLSVPYARQLQHKQQRLAALFERVMPIQGMDTPYHYRNKVIAAVAHDRDGLVTGQYVYGTHYVLRQDKCLLENECASRIVRASREILEEARVPAWDERRQTGLLHFIQVRYAARTDQALVTWVTSGQPVPDGETLARRLCEREPTVRGVVQNLNPRSGSAVLGFEERTLYGRPYIEDEMCGLKVSLSSRAFYQVNTVQAERLYQRALDLAALDGTQTVVDAYCGIGLIGLLAARRARQVTGIEQNASAVRLAGRIADMNGIRNIRFERGDAAAVLMKHPPAADVILLDPPREGLSAPMIRALTALRIPKVIYISCNPETQARDIALLAPAGYRCSPVWPYDLFPHTDHVETVCQLTHS